MPVFNNLLVIDLLLFVIVNIANLLSFFIFFSRVKLPSLEYKLDILIMLTAIPAAFISVTYMIAEREWWFWFYPLLFVIFMILELIVDYIKKVEFRQPRNLKILVPYLVLFYVSIAGMWYLQFWLGFLYGS